MWSLPDMLLQPLLVRLRLDMNESMNPKRGAKNWLMSADPALRNVVTKEALQWKKTTVNQVSVCSHQCNFQMVGLLSNSVLKYI